MTAAPDWPQHAAVAVIGGGTAGCATALALAQLGVGGVVVVEAGAPRRFRIGETIPPATGVVLRRLGLWPEFLAQGHVACPGSRSSWGKPDLGYNDFLFDPLGCGWHLDRAAFDRLLAETVAARGTPVFRGHRLHQISSLGERGFELGFEAGAAGPRTLRADFLVDASGVAAAAARRLGVARNQIDCLVALYGVIGLAEPEAISAQTLLEATGDGWWYAARLPIAPDGGGRLVAALSTDRATIVAEQLREPAAWKAALRRTRHLASLVDQARPVDEATWPDPEPALAVSAILSRVVGPRWLAVGDAASSYDPLTSQGIIKALSEGEAAAAAIAAALGGGEAPLLAYQDGVFARFTDYLRLRQHWYDRERRWLDQPFWRDRPRFHYR